jgi:hypothetical protein
MKALRLVLLTFFAVTAHAEVKESTPNLFVVERSVATTAAPAAAYTALTRQVGKWWDGAHTWSGNARNLSIDARAGGCFCEKLAAGGSVAHGRVIWAQPGKMLRIDAALGPLQDMAVSAVLSFKLEPEGSGTKLTLIYRASGNFTMDSAKLAPLVDKVLGVQLSRLQAFADTGNPVKNK